MPEPSEIIQSVIANPVYTGLTALALNQVAYKAGFWDPRPQLPPEVEQRIAEARDTISQLQLELNSLFQIGWGNLTDNQRDRWREILRLQESLNNTIVSLQNTMPRYYKSVLHTGINFSGGFSLDILNPEWVEASKEEIAAGNASTIGLFIMIASALYAYSGRVVKVGS